MKGIKESSSNPAVAGQVSKLPPPVVPPREPGGRFRWISACAAITIVGFVTPLQGFILIVSMILGALPQAILCNPVGVLSGFFGTRSSGLQGEDTLQYRLNT